MKSEFSLDNEKISNVHFIGIGGVSMSGLAEIMCSLGYNVTGSDMKSSPVTKKLSNIGIKIYEEHHEDYLENPDLVVYTAAISKDNPELLKAKSLNIPTIERAILLGKIMEKYPFAIAISGTHGKTTTTSMVSSIMLQSELNPTIHIGGHLNIIDGNTKIGGNHFFVTEACEYVESFLNFNPYLAVILNIEADHLDYFKDLEHIKESFLKFASLLPSYGYLVACADDKNVLEIANKVSTNIITFGISSNATWTAKNISFDRLGCASFDLFKSGEKVDTIKLNVPGIHNVSNALAAIAVCDIAKCSIDDIKIGLNKFNGTGRRFELKGIIKDVRIIDDYAHHPSEIKATLNALSNYEHNKIWCVFQPHTYTRTKFLLEEFASAFKQADYILITDIYAAREKNNYEINSQILTDKINSVSKNAQYFENFNYIADFLKQNVSPGDIIVTMGAGDIYKVAELLIESV